MSLAKSVPILSLFKESALSCINLIYCLFGLCFIYFCSDLCYFLHSKRYFKVNRSLATAVPYNSFYPSFLSKHGITRISILIISVQELGCQSLHHIIDTLIHFPLLLRAADLSVSSLSISASNPLALKTHTLSVK